MENFKSLAEATDFIEKVVERVDTLEELNKEDGSAAVAKDLDELKSRVIGLSARLDQVDEFNMTVSDRLDRAERMAVRVPAPGSAPEPAGKFVPAWLYGPGGASELVKNQQRFDYLLGEGWADTPDSVEGGKRPAMEV